MHSCDSLCSDGTLIYILLTVHMGTLPLNNCLISCQIFRIKHFSVSIGLVFCIPYFCQQILINLSGLSDILAVIHSTDKMKTF